MPAVSKKQQRYFGYLLSNPEERKKKGITKKAAKDFAQDVKEVAPPGWGHTKKDKVASMFKLMWSMKKKGAKPHYKPGTDEKYKKYQDKDETNESLSVKDTKKLDKASALSQSNDPKDQERARARQTEIDYKDLMDQRKKGKVGVGKSMKTEGIKFDQFRKRAASAMKKVASKKDPPKHDYGRDVAIELRKKIKKRDHEKVNFLDPED
jgi:hypothetical protein